MQDPRDDEIQQLLQQVQQLNIDNQKLKNKGGC